MHELLLSRAGQCDVARWQRWVRPAAWRGHPARRCRATKSKLAAATLACTYASKEGKPLHAQRVSAKQRLRKEMTPSIPARKLRSFLNTQELLTMSVTVMPGCLLNATSCTPRALIS